MMLIGTMPLRYGEFSLRFLDGAREQAINFDPEQKGGVKATTSCHLAVERLVSKRPSCFAG